MLHEEMDWATNHDIVWYREHTKPIKWDDPPEPNWPYGTHAIVERIAVSSTIWKCRPYYQGIPPNTMYGVFLRFVEYLKAGRSFKEAMLRIRRTRDMPCPSLKRFMADPLIKKELEGIIDTHGNLDPAMRKELVRAIRTKIAVKWHDSDDPKEAKLALDAANAIAGEAEIGLDGDSSAQDFGRGLGEAFKGVLNAVKQKDDGVIDVSHEIVEAKEITDGKS